MINLKIQGISICLQLLQHFRSQDSRPYSLTPLPSVHQGLLKAVMQLFEYTQYLVLMRFREKAAIITVQRRHQQLLVIILEFVHLFLVAFILNQSNIKLGLNICFFSEVSVPLTILQQNLFCLTCPYLNLSDAVLH